MKKLIITLILLLGVILNAQNRRFIYEYKYITDSTARDKPETEIMLLDVVPKGSKFYSKEVFESDSIMEATVEKQVQAGTEVSYAGVKFKGKIRYSVEKNYPDYSINFFNSLSVDEYMVQDARKQDWKILSDKEKIGEFTAQKAICNFAGRKWIAWFSTELPIQDGPYKFCGLPGLIVKLEDATHSHTFELKGNKKLPADYDWKTSKEKLHFNKIITVNEVTYRKAFKDYRADPMKGEKQMLAQGSNILEIDESGNLKPSSDKGRRDRQLKLLADIKKQNNILELDLLK